ncbi:MAG: hypothetical protein COB36_14085 [Alphaproteobacteria bacterium]|nr:MAG: hypothetical protein COB36_14085 [Alphaproteobacteria bacterium]
MQALSSSENIVSSPQIIAVSELQAIREQHSGVKIIHCHGVFDVFHHGHLEYLQSAKDMGDILIVTVTSDRWVNKGPTRPYHNHTQRAEIIANLGFVDYVAVNDESSAVPVIEALKPNFYVKGKDYENKEDDITGAILAEERAVEAGGGKLVFTQTGLKSSTRIINEHLTSQDGEARRVIKKIRENYEFEDIVQIVNSFTDIKVLVVGEPIIDTYTFCQSEALSSKSPTVSARFVREENYAGGSLAIANHLANLGCDVHLCTVFGDEDYVQKLLDKSMDDNVRISSYVIPDVPTPRKTRFLQQGLNQKIFEVTNISDDLWDNHDSAEFCAQLKSAAKDADVVICADFGHGMMEGAVLDVLSELDVFVATNVQTNSSNLGYNLFTKHEDYSFLSIDERELRLGLHDRSSPISKLLEKAQEVIKKPFAITLGINGSVYFDQNGEQHACPVFFQEVVDTTGAGDAFFLITSLLAQKDIDGDLISFMGNCYAWLATQVIGNKKANSTVDYIRTMKSLLG